MENGFAEPVDAVDDDLEGGEGDAAGPRPPFERSPLRVLASLEHRPLEQAMKAIEYITNTRERERRFLRACTPKALGLIAQNGPEYEAAVDALRN